MSLEEDAIWAAMPKLAKTPAAAYRREAAISSSPVARQAMLAKAEALEAAAVDDELRRLMNLDAAAIGAYDPEKAVSKCGKRWQVATTSGKSFPTLYATRTEALALACKHLDLKRQQLAKPSSFSDSHWHVHLEGLRRGRCSGAGDRVMRVLKYHAIEPGVPYEYAIMAERRRFGRVRKEEAKTPPYQWTGRWIADNGWAAKAGFRTRKAAALWLTELTPYREDPIA